MSMGITWVALKCVVRCLADVWPERERRHHESVGSNLWSLLASSHGITLPPSSDFILLIFQNGWVCRVDIQIRQQMVALIKHLRTQCPDGGMIWEKLLNQKYVLGMIANIFRNVTCDEVGIGYETWCCSSLILLCMPAHHIEKSIDVIRTQNLELVWCALNYHVSLRSTLVDHAKILMLSKMRQPQSWTPRYAIDFWTNTDITLTIMIPRIRFLLSLQ